MPYLFFGPFLTHVVSHLVRRIKRAIYVGNSTLSAVEFLPASTLVQLTSSPNRQTTLGPPGGRLGSLNPLTPGHRKHASSASASNTGSESPRSVSQFKMVEDTNLLPAKLRAKARKQQQVDEDMKKIDLLAACTTQYLFLWEGVAGSSGPVTVAEEIKTPHPIMILKWIPEHSRLYAGTSIGTVDAYEIVYEQRDKPGNE